MSQGYLLLGSPADPVAIWTLMVSMARLPSSSQSDDRQRPLHPGWLGPPSQLPASRTHRPARVRACSEFSASAWLVTKADGPKGDRKGWDLVLAWEAAQGSPSTKQPGACPVLGEGAPRAQRWAGTTGSWLGPWGFTISLFLCPEVLACPSTCFLCAQVSPLPKPGGLLPAVCVRGAVGGLRT